MKKLRKLTSYYCDEKHGALCPTDDCFFMNSFYNFIVYNLYFYHNFYERDRSNSLNQQKMIFNSFDFVAKLYPNETQSIKETMSTEAITLSAQ